MLELFQKYSISDIIIFLIIFCLALKSLFTFVDWAKEKLKKYFKKETTSVQQQEEINHKIGELEERVGDLEKKFSDIMDKIDLLIISDRDDIKAFITQQYHFFCEEKKWIDDYSLDCLEKRFNHYIEEDGNSFIEGLMVELRALPKHPPVQ